MINVTTLILKLSIFPFLDGDVPRSTSNGVYISQLFCFAWASSYVTDFNTHNKVWYLIVSIPDLCTLTYFKVILMSYDK